VIGWIGLAISEINDVQMRKNLGVTCRRGIKFSFHDFFCNMNYIIETLERDLP
jgi:hypothetical protein